MFSVGVVEWLLCCVASICIASFIIFVHELQMLIIELSLLFANQIYCSKKFDVHTKHHSLLCVCFCISHADKSFSLQSHALSEGNRLGLHTSVAHVKQQTWDSTLEIETNGDFKVMSTFVQSAFLFPYTGIGLIEIVVSRLGSKVTFGPV